MAWTGTSPSGGSAVYAQVFGKNNEPVTQPIKVFGELAAFAAISVAVRADGSFAVAAGGNDGSAFISGNGVLIATFSANGTPLSAPSIVNSTTDYGQSDGDIAALPTGGFFAVWTSDNQDYPGRWDQGIYGRFIDRNGSPFGAEIRIPVEIGGREQRPSVSVSKTGEIVVSWDNGDEVFARLFDRDGNPLTAEFRVNSWTANAQYDPSVTYLANGNFVITWTSDSNGNSYTGQDGSSAGVFGQLFSSNGSKLGSEFQVNSTTEYMQWFSDVTALSDGGFVVAWESAGRERAAYAQQFGPDGARAGLEMLIAVTENQPAPTIAEVAPGLLALGWGEFVNGVVKAHSALVRSNVLAGSDASDDLRLETSDPVTVLGGAGDDRITAGAGNDVINGGAGADRVAGGRGADAFIGTAAELNGDVIADFGFLDRLVISDATPGSFTYSISGQTLSFGGGATVTLPVGIKALAASAAPEGGVQLKVSTASQTLATLTLTEAGQDITVGGHVRIAGTPSGGETITILRGIVTLDPSFNTGGDTIVLPGAADTYIARLTGSVVTVQSDDLSVAIPVGTAGLVMQFGDASRTLSFNPVSGQVLLGGQAITGVASPLAAATGSFTAPSDSSSPTSFAKLTLTEAGQDLEVGGNVRIVGTTAPGEVISILGGNVVFDPSFNTGGDMVVLPGKAESFSVRLSGAFAIFSNDDASVSVPVGSAGLQVAFEDATRTLLFDPAMGRVFLGSQMLGSAAQAVTPGTQPTGLSEEDAMTLWDLSFASDAVASHGHPGNEAPGTLSVDGAPEWNAMAAGGGWLVLG